MHWECDNHGTMEQTNPDETSADVPACAQLWSICTTVPEDIQLQIVATASLHITWQHVSWQHAMVPMLFL
eukprot:CAMPEP_0172803542 /NCGR_PEP_ID=MMETSP1075-20121228/4574_1 /TAXON_ID=2916 /ORGANISM="Ceratium fusus, Strain PA161109" /LENGTH=69 /DNA_ID=CAMNT_0013641983 /DNA_START=139 /DNA_END=345 /DNA_ORIENTATION=+